MPSAGGWPGGGSAWESNPPGRVTRDRTGFEDRGRHRATTAPVRRMVARDEGRPRGAPTPRGPGGRARCPSRHVPSCGASGRRSPPTGRRLPSGERRCRSTLWGPCSGKRRPVVDGGRTPVQTAFGNAPTVGAHRRAVGRWSGSPGRSFAEDRQVARSIEGIPIEHAPFDARNGRSGPVRPRTQLGGGRFLSRSWPPRAAELAAPGRRGRGDPCRRARDERGDP